MTEADAQALAKQAHARANQGRGDLTLPDDRGRAWLGPCVHDDLVNVTGQPGRQRGSVRR